MSERIFLTGATGYIGAHAAVWLLRNTDHRLALLVRAGDEAQAARRLWKSMQITADFEEVRGWIDERIDFCLGDLTDTNLGLPAAQREMLAAEGGSVLHIAASLNRKSAKACFNVNLRGTLEVIGLAQAMARGGGLRRFTDVSTVAVAGHRSNECVTEDAMVDWERSDYDPYARTKKFCEHMVERMLPGEDTIVVRPATVMGDTRHGATTQFDMVQAAVWLAKMPVVPLDPAWRMDIVPVDFVSEAIARLHVKPTLRHRSFNLSAGERSQRYGEIYQALADRGFPNRPRFVAGLAQPFGATVDRLAYGPRSWPTTWPASLMKVFWPYIAYNTVFDNAHTIEETGLRPVPFTEYAWELLRFATENDFQYPYLDWPEDG